MARPRKELPLLMRRKAVMAELDVSEWELRQLVELRHLTRVGKGKIVKFKGEDVQAYVDSLEEYTPPE